MSKKTKVPTYRDVYEKAYGQKIQINNTNASTGTGKQINIG